MGALTERHVQAIWYDAALRPSRLVSRRGEEIRVVDPGEWNLGPGPDFLRAVLEIGTARRRVCGDVEIHLCPADWDLHRHGCDPRYRNVIAHVTWGCGPVPCSLPAGAVSVWIGRFVTADTSFSPDCIDLSAYPFARLPADARPCEERIGHDPDRARAILAAAGRARLEMKARRLAGRTCERPERERQIFYEEVMTALGYSRNAVQFRHIAERLPVDDLPDSVAAVRSAMLVAGGFETWERSGLRPENFPERRLEKAADVFSSGEVLDLKGAADFSKGGCREMTRILCRDRNMGRGRAGAVVANVILPFALAAGHVGEIPEWLPPEDISGVVRLTAFRMFGRDHNPVAFYADNGLLIQGLIHIHRSHCLACHPDCTPCSVGS